jgi:hypothetical protein
MSCYIESDSTIMVGVATRRVSVLTALASEARNQAILAARGVLTTEEPGRTCEPRLSVI